MEHVRLNTTFKQMVRRGERRLTKETKEILRHESLGESARAMKQAKNEGRGGGGCVGRKETQLVPVAFTKHMVVTDQQDKFHPIGTRWLLLREDIEQRVRKFI